MWVQGGNMKLYRILWVVIVVSFLSFSLRAEKDNAVQQGWENYHSKKFVDAMASFKKSPQNNPDALVGMAYAEFKLGRYWDAVYHIKAAQKISPTFETIHEKITLPGVEGEFDVDGNGKSLLGWSYYLLGYYNDAIKTLKEVTKEHPDWVASRHGLGLAFVAMGKLPQAKQEFQEIKKHDPKYAGADIGLSTIGAIKSYQAQNVALEPIYKAWYQLNIGSYKVAVNQFNAILQNTTKRVPKGELWRVHLGLAWSQYWLGDFAKAKQNFMSALDQNANTAYARKGMAFCEFKMKQFDKAITQLKRYLEEVPGDTDAIINIAWSYYNKKDYQNAIQEFSFLTINYPLIADAHFGLTLCFYEGKNFTKAKESFARAVNLYPWYVDGPLFKQMLTEQKDWKAVNNDIGWAFYYKADYKKAMTHFEMAGNGHDKFNLKGRAYTSWQLAKNDQAISLLNEFLQQSITKDEKVEALNSLGWSHYNKAQYNEAINAFNESRKIYNSLEAVRGLGWAYHKKKDFQNAITHFEALAKDYPLLADAKNGLGWAYFGKNDFTRAADEFDKCLLLLPGHYEAQLGLSKINKNFIQVNEAWYWYNIGYIQKAQGRFMAVLNKLPESEKWRAHAGIAWCYYSLGQTQKALSIFKEKVLAVRPNDPMTLRGIGFAHYILGQYAEEVPYLEKFSSQYPLSSEGQGYLSWASFRAGKFDQALKHFKKFMEQYPLLPEAQGGLALTYFKLNQPEKAHEQMLKAVNLSSVISNLPDYQAMLEEHTDWSDVFAISGWGYLNSFYYLEAEKYFNLALVHNPDDVEVQRGLGLVQYYMGTYTKASQTLSKVARELKDSEKIWGKKSVVLSALAWSYYFSGQNENSIQAFQELVDLHASNDIYADPYDGLGWNYLKLKDYSKAKEAFNKALSLAPMYASPKRGLASIPAKKS